MSCDLFHAYFTVSTVSSIVAFLGGKLQEMDLLSCDYDEAEQEEAGLLQKLQCRHIIQFWKQALIQSFWWLQLNISMHENTKKVHVSPNLTRETHIKKFQCFNI